MQDNIIIGSVNSLKDSKINFSGAGSVLFSRMVSIYEVLIFNSMATIVLYI